MASVKTKKGFKTFLTKFPIIKDLPLVLNEDARRRFSLSNKPVSNETVEQFCLDDGETYADEYTEYVACFRLPDTADFYGFVLWRGSLLEYSYLLVTFDKRGGMIEKNVIGGTKVVDGRFHTIEATVKSNTEIVVVELESTDGSHAPTQTKNSPTKRLSISKEGKMTLINN